MDLFNRIEAIWDNLKAGEAKSRAHFTINRDHIDNGALLGPRFQPNQHYFQIVINEMFLANEREWYIDYAPMTFVACGYDYDGQAVTQPVVVGPTMLKQFEQKLPSGMIFQNTPVTGLHPYRGGSLSLTIILSKLQRQNNADKLLQVVESIAGAVDPTGTLSPYLKIARAVTGGFETLLGLQQTAPVLGYHTTISPDIGQKLEPAFIALINEDAQRVERDQFWVVNSKLHYGQNLADVQPYRAHDFILFSIAQGDTRSDTDMLPFSPLWKTTRDLAAHAGNHYWEDAKAQFQTLARELINCPDLTEPDVQRLIEQYKDELKQTRRQTELAGQLGIVQLPPGEAELQRIADEISRL